MKGKVHSPVQSVFLVLAAMTLLALGLSLGLFHRLAGLHEAAVTLSADHAVKRSQLLALERLAGILFAPGNDIFLSGDSASEKQRLVDAAAAFRAESEKVREEWKDDLSNSRLLSHIDRGLAAVTLVEADAHRTIDAYSRGDFQGASRAMAEMDRTREKLSDPIAAARKDLIQKDRFFLQEQQKELTQTWRQETASAMVLLFLTVATVMYGRRAAREMITSKERDRYIAQLQEREVALTSMIAQLDTQARNLEQAQSIAGLGSWHWDIASNAIEWSAELYRMFGTAPESFGASYEGYLTRVHPDDRERVDLAVRMSLRTQEPFEHEHRIVRPDGSESIIYARGNVESDASGSPVRMFGVAHDISSKRAAEKELQRSEQRFQLASRATNDVVWDWNLLTNALWMSEGWMLLFGYATSGDMDIDGWAAAIHPEDLDRVLKTIHEAIDGPEMVWSGEYRMRAASGVYLQVMDRGFIIRDDAGTAIRMIGAMMDVTARKESEIAVARMHRKTELILQSVADGLFDIDLDGVSTFVNPAAAHMLEYEPDELVGRQMHATIHYKRDDGSDFPWSECPECLTLIDGAGRSSRTVFWTKSGKSVPIEFTTLAIVDETGAVTGAVKTFRDISQRLIVDRMKDEFVSTVSHELRTPLTSIRGALGLLNSGRLGTLPEKAARLLEIASTNTDRLVRLINDILDIERMESGKVTLAKAPTDAADLVRQATDLMRPLAEQGGITLTVHASPLPLIADTDRIVQTLTNLIGNAVKFSPPRTTVAISTEAIDGAVLFRVADQGRGIPVEKLETVFERFKQVDASDSREKGGSGLGLAICRSIVRQHGGEISVTSEVGKGSEFAFSVPAFVVTPPVVSTLPAGEARGRLVFICDDEVDARDVMSVLLTAHGYRVMEFSRGADMLEAALRQRPDLILLDLFMPDMNGWEALARLRTDPQVADIPVVVVSVLSPDECESPYLDLCGWLHKPLAERDLLEAVQGALHPQSPTRRLLIVEDDADLARVIAGSFERHGLEVVVVSTGQQAIDLASTFVPDLVVLDLMLPQIDGFGVIDWIKDNGLWRGVPLIVYSALETTPSQQERLRLGPTEFITKSRIEPQDFERRVLHLLDRITEGQEQVSWKAAG